MELHEILAHVGTAFQLPGTMDSYEVIPYGHINNTYKVTYRGGDGALTPYIFQRVNQNVFPNTVGLMNNIDGVTSYISRKYPKENTLHFFRTAEDNCYFTDETGFWRVTNYFESDTYNTCEDPEVIAGVGEAIGRFQLQLADYDGQPLVETIPNFHNTRKRFNDLFASAQKDVCGRAASVAEELAYMQSVAETASELSDRYAAGEFPRRVTHNDTKANNVLFEKGTKRPLVVIDLDTVMPGMAMYDFGDAVRFIVSTAAEDEPDLKRIYFDTGKFRAFCSGYLKQVKNALTKPELDSLVLAAFSITLESASRFLADYLDGDVYFKIHYPEHNLVRARSQIRLAQDIARKRDELEWIVRETIEQA